MATQLNEARRATARLRLRPEASTRLPKVGMIEPGTIFTPVRQLAGEEVSGNALWYELAGQVFVWSGASEPAPQIAVHAAPGMDVPRRPDNGAIAVLSVQEIEATYGKFSHQPGKKRGAVVVDSGWVAANLTKIKTPLLAEENYPTMTVHKMAAGPFLRVFSKIEAAGLGGRILTCAGTWVARHKGWDPSRTLSAHSWGIAIDLNAGWNGYGVPPAPMGAVGSLRELVPIFESEGFAWGGYFTPSKWADGMHFELARRDL